MQFLASLSSWAVDLADTAAIYPGQGLEVIMIIVGFVLWIGWHVWQIKHENQTLAAEEARIKANSDLLKGGIDGRD